MCFLIIIRRVPVQRCSSTAVHNTHAYTCGILYKNACSLPCREHASWFSACWARSAWLRAL